MLEAIRDHYLATGRRDRDEARRRHPDDASRRSTTSCIVKETLGDALAHARPLPHRGVDASSTTSSCSSQKEATRAVPERGRLHEGLREREAGRICLEREERKAGAEWSAARARSRSSSPTSAASGSTRPRRSRPDICRSLRATSSSSAASSSRRVRRRFFATINPATEEIARRGRRGRRGRRRRGRARGRGRLPRSTGRSMPGRSAASTSTGSRGCSRRSRASSPSSRR